MKRNDYQFILIFFIVVGNMVKGNGILDIEKEIGLKEIAILDAVEFSGKIHTLEKKLSNNYSEIKSHDIQNRITIRSGGAPVNTRQINYIGLVNYDDRIFAVSEQGAASGSGRPRTRSRTIRGRNLGSKRILPNEPSYVKSVLGSGELNGRYYFMLKSDGMVTPFDASQSPEDDIDFQGKIGSKAKVVDITNVKSGSLLLKAVIADSGEEQLCRFDSETKTCCRYFPGLKFYLPLGPDTGYVLYENGKREMFWNYVLDFVISEEVVEKEDYIVMKEIDSNKDAFFYIRSDQVDGSHYFGFRHLWEPGLSFEQKLDDISPTGIFFSSSTLRYIGTYGRKKTITENSKIIVFGKNTDTSVCDGNCAICDSNGIIGKNCHYCVNGYKLFKEDAAKGSCITEAVCNSRGRYVLSNSCLKKCPEAIALYDNKECSYCRINHCADCTVDTNEDKDECSRCKNGWLLDNNNCDTECSEGCVACSLKASNCSGCKDGYFLDGNRCMKCDSSCRRCRGNKDHCLECHNGAILFENGCFEECPAYTILTLGNTCRFCKKDSDYFSIFGNCYHCYLWNNEEQCPSATKWSLVEQEISIERDRVRIELSPGLEPGLTAEEIGGLDFNRGIKLHALHKDTKRSSGVRISDVAIIDSSPEKLSLSLVYDYKDNQEHEFEKLILSSKDGNSILHETTPIIRKDDKFIFLERASFEIGLNHPRYFDVVSSYFSERSSKVYFEFEEPIEIPELEELEITITHQTNQNGEQVNFKEFEVAKISRAKTATKIIEIELKITNRLENGTLSIKLKGRKRFKGTIGGSQCITRTLEANNMSYGYLESVSSFQSASGTTQIIFHIATLLTLVTAPKLGSSFIELFQLFELLIFVDVNIPLNFLEFLRIVSSTIFEIIPNFIVINEADQGNTLHPVIENEGLSVYVLNNAGNLYVQIAALLALKLLVMILRNKLGCSQKSFIAKIDLKLNLGYFVNFFICLQISLLIPVMINLRNFRLGGIPNFFNSAMSLFTFAGYLGLNILVLWRVRRLSRLEEKYGEEGVPEEDKRWKFLKEDLKEGLPSSKSNHVCLLSLKDFASCFLLLSLIDIRIPQILVMLLIYGVSFALNLRNWAFSETSVNIITLSQDIYFFLIYLTFLALIPFGGPQDRRDRFGVFMIVISCAIIGLSMKATNSENCNSSSMNILNEEEPVQEPVKMESKSKLRPVINDVATDKTSKKRVQNTPCLRMQDLGVVAIVSKKRSRKNVD